MQLYFADFATNMSFCPGLSLDHVISDLALAVNALLFLYVVLARAPALQSTNFRALASNNKVYS